MMNAYKFRMYPNKAQTAILEETLEICRRLWNTALADRKNTYKETGVGRTYNQQAAILTIEKKEKPELKTVFSQVLQNVLKRVDIGTAAFFKRLREGAKEPGFPRFKREGQYKSFTYPGSGFEIEDDHLILSKIGTIRIKNHHLAKSMSDHAWGMLIRNTISKAESAGKIVVLVNPYNTSQRCSNCGAKVPKDISTRVHACPRCGLVMCRDRNAALVILADGLSVSAYRDMASTSGELLQQATSMK